MEKTNGGFLITQIKQIQGRIFERLLIEEGIHEFNGAQGRILFVLWEEDDVPIRVLSEKTGLAKTTLTSMLDRLETAGHIRRVGDPSDRRSVKISLTPKAKGLKERYDRVSAEMSSIFYRGFTDEEVFAFEESLRKVLKNLTEKEKNHE